MGIHPNGRGESRIREHSFPGLFNHVVGSESTHRVSRSRRRVVLFRCLANEEKLFEQVSAEALRSGVLVGAAESWPSTGEAYPEVVV